MLGDQQFNLYAESVSQYRSLALSYTEPVAPIPVRAAGLLADAVLLRELRRHVLRGQYGLPQPRSRWRRRPSAAARASAIYPLNRYARLELTGGLISSSRSTTTRRCSSCADEYQQQLYGQSLFADGKMHAARRRLRARDDGVP